MSFNRLIKEIAFIAIIFYTLFLELFMGQPLRLLEQAQASPVEAGEVQGQASMLGSRDSWSLNNQWGLPVQPPIPRIEMPAVSIPSWRHWPIQLAPRRTLSGRSSRPHGSEDDSAGVPVGQCFGGQCANGNISGGGMPGSIGGAAGIGNSGGMLGQLGRTAVKLAPMALFAMLMQRNQGDKQPAALPTTVPTAATGTAPAPSATQPPPANINPTATPAVSATSVATAAPQNTPQVSAARAATMPELSSIEAF